MDKLTEGNDYLDMKLVVLSLLFALMGCAYPKRSDFFASVEANPKKAVLYIYRTQTSVDSLNPDIPFFYVNDVKIGRLSLGGYYRVEIEPGPLKINYRTPLFGIPMFMSAQKLETTVAPNNIYFVKFSIESIMRISELKLVSPSTGLYEIKNTQLLLN